MKKVGGEEGVSVGCVSRDAGREGKRRKERGEGGRKGCRTA